MITEEQLKEVLVGIYETDYKDNQSFEEFADGWDFWVDKDGYILIEGRGMEGYGRKPASDLPFAIRQETLWGLERRYGRESPKVAR